MRKQKSNKPCDTHDENTESKTIRTKSDGTTYKKCLKCGTFYSVKIRRI